MDIGERDELIEEWTLDPNAVGPEVKLWDAAAALARTADALGAAGLPTAFAGAEGGAPPDLLVGLDLERGLLVRARPGARNSHPARWRLTVWGTANRLGESPDAPHRKAAAAALALRRSLLISQFAAGQVTPSARRERAEPREGQSEPRRESAQRTPASDADTERRWRRRGNLWAGVAFSTGLLLSLLGLFFLDVDRFTAALRDRSYLPRFLEVFVHFGHLVLLLPLLLGAGVAALLLRRKAARRRARSLPAEVRVARTNPLERIESRLARVEAADCLADTPRAVSFALQCLDAEFGTFRTSAGA